MRVWDIDPGYLNRQSLLGEHRELHGIVSIITNNKKGYSRHPETLRWVGYGWALCQRHRLLATEMRLRGYVDRTPVRLRSNNGEWPEIFIDPPHEQLVILAHKYATLEQGRIPLPKNAQQLWAQHKYSVMARDLSAYKNIGTWVVSKQGNNDVAEVARELTTLLRQPPNSHYLQNTLLHMWGYVSKYTDLPGKEMEKLSTRKLLTLIQGLVLANHVTYLVHSTALSELNAWK